SSESMEPTLRPGQRFDTRVVASGSYTPHRGDIVVFRWPPSWEAGGGKTVSASRVVAIGGDRIACCDTQRRVTVNGAPLDEPYLYPGDPASDLDFDVRVPPGQLWLMGDHRAVARDSRRHIYDGDRGTVPATGVIAVLIHR